MDGHERQGRRSVFRIEGGGASPKKGHILEEKGAYIGKPRIGKSERIQLSIVRLWYIILYCDYIISVAFNIFALFTWFALLLKHHNLYCSCKEDQIENNDMILSTI